MPDRRSERCAICDVADWAGDWGLATYMAGVGQAELGAFDNQERALANILWRATWGHGMCMDCRPIAASGAGGYAVRRADERQV